ncbi:hypothetical protein [Candidatus Leptofilum sp.]|uniref:hypothetical protein n=1 Tax=Candidatus Leptofilum sp. TaxID=3241576 RepID=UPI003B5B7994
MIGSIKQLIYHFVHWKEINIGNTQRHILIPTKFGALLFVYLLYTLTRISWFYGDWRTFTSQHHEFAIDYPAHWVKLGEYTNGYKNQDDLAVHFISGDAFLVPSQSSIKVHHRRMPNGTLENIADWGLDLIEITGGGWSISQLEDSNIGLEDYPVLIQTYRKHSRLRLKTFLITNVYVLSGEDAYILQFSAPAHKIDEFEGIFDRVLTSFNLNSTSSKENDT